MASTHIFFSRNLSVFFTMSSERFREVSVLCSLALLVDSPAFFLLLYYQSSSCSLSSCASLFLLLRRCSFFLMLCCVSQQSALVRAFRPPSHATWMSNLRSREKGSTPRLINFVYSNENLFNKSHKIHEEEGEWPRMREREKRSSRRAENEMDDD